MSGAFTDAQKHWLSKLHSFQGDAASSAKPSTSAEPASGPAAASAGNQPAKMLATPFGDLPVLAVKAAAVQSGIDKAAAQYDQAEAASDQLEELSTSLKKVLEKYDGMSMGDITDEINKHTDRTLKSDASDVQEDAVVNDGFTIFLDQMKRSLDRTKEDLRINKQDVDAAEIYDQANADEKIGKEMQEHVTALLEGISKLGEMTAHVMAIAAKPAEPSGWIEGANDLFKLFSAGSNDFLQKAAELRAQADKMKNDSLRSRVNNAITTMQDLKGGIAKQENVVKHASENLERRQNARDSNYDAPGKDGKSGPGKFKFGEMKKGIQLAKDLRETALEASAGAHNSRISLVKVLQNFKTSEEWLADVQEGNKVLDAWLAGVKAIYDPADKKVGVGKALLTKFSKTYNEAGKAAADAPGTGS